MCGKTRLAGRIARNGANRQHYCLSQRIRTLSKLTQALSLYNAYRLSHLRCKGQQRSGHYLTPLSCSMPLPTYRTSNTISYTTHTQLCTSTLQRLATGWGRHHDVLLSKPCVQTATQEPNLSAGRDARKAFHCKERPGKLRKSCQSKYNCAAQRTPAMTALQTGVCGGLKPSALQRID